MVPNLEKIFRKEVMKAMTNYETVCVGVPEYRRRRVATSGRKFLFASGIHAGDRFDERFLKKGQVDHQLLLACTAWAVAQCIAKNALSNTLKEIGGQKFVLYAERANLAFFLGGGPGHYPSQRTFVFVYSVYCRRGTEPIYYEKENVKRILLRRDGTAGEEPDGPLFQLRWQDRP